jgi:hypothetical protein
MSERNYRTEDFDLVDLYITYNPMEAQFIKDMLDDNDIASFIRGMEVSQFPMNVGTMGETRVVVESDKLRAAVDLIEEAIKANAITSEGRFIFEEN